MQQFGCIVVCRIVNGVSMDWLGAGEIVFEGFMTKEVMYIGRLPMAGGFDESCEPKVCCVCACCEALF